MTGIRRVVLINNDQVEYADVDLTRPTHLTGPNNKGKTTLIRAFQFLYVDDWGEMAFGQSDRTASRKHYFQENSYILFEADSPSGIKLIGFRGLGPQNDYSYERFVVNGDYERDCFFDGDRIRDWDDISQNYLLPRVLKPQTKLILDRKELRNAITGVGESCGVRLDLVPSENYDAFRAVFKRLISLDEMVGRDAFAELFIDVLGKEIEIRTLDLAHENEKLTEDIRKHEHELNTLEGVQPAAKRLEADFKNLNALMEGLPGEWGFLNEAITRGIDGLREQLVAQDDLAAKRRDEIADRQRDLRELNGEIANLRGERGGIKNALDEMNREREGYHDLNQASLRDVASNLAEALSEAETRLRVMGNAENRRTIENNLERLAAQRTRLETQLANPNVSWSASVLGECSQGERDALLRLVHPDIIRLPEGPDGVTIKDPNAVFGAITSLTRPVRGDVYEDAAVRINLQGVRPPSVGVFDIAEIEKDIEAIQAQEATQKALLDSAKSKDALVRDIEKLKREASTAQRNVFGFEAWAKKEEGRPVLERRAAECDAAIRQKTGRSGELTDQIETLKGQADEHGRWVERTERQVKALRGTRDSLDLLRSSEWEIPPVSPEASVPHVDAIPGQFQAFRDRAQKASALHERVANAVELMQQNLGSLIHGCGIPEMMAALVEQMESIPDRRDVLHEEKKSLVRHSSRRFVDFYRGFESVKALAARVNRGLAEIQVSDLRSVEVKIIPTAEAALIEEFANSQTSPLYAPDPAGVDEAIRRLAEQKGSFKLSNLFEFRLKVVKNHGETKTYDRPEGESKGTGLTIKLIVLARMLRELAKSKTKDRARLPVFIDEAQQFDDANRSNVIRAATDLGFGVISASPTPVSITFGRVYFLDTTGAKTWITADGPHLLVEEDGTMVGAYDPDVEVLDGAPVE